MNVEKNIAMKKYTEPKVTPVHDKDGKADIGHLRAKDATARLKMDMQNKEAGNVIHASDKFLQKGDEKEKKPTGKEIESLLLNARTCLGDCTSSYDIIASERSQETKNKLKEKMISQSATYAEDINKTLAQLDDSYKKDELKIIIKDELIKTRKKLASNIEHLSKF